VEIQTGSGSAEKNFLDLKHRKETKYNNTYVDPEWVFLEVLVLHLVVVHGVGVEPDQGNHHG